MESSLRSSLKSIWIVIALATLVATASPALAHGKYRHKYRHLPPQCVDRPVEFSWYDLFFRPAPKPNGCAPPVFSDGYFLGQDPDSFIRYGLLRDPDTGYANPDQN